MLTMYFINDDVFLDFRTLTEIVSGSLSESTLYRKLTKTCERQKYRNRMLFRYRDLLENPYISKEIRQYELHK